MEGEHYHGSLEDHLDRGIRKSVGNGSRVG
jgi:hypothetical protein